MANGTERLALVIGATGGFGGAMAQRLLADGWRVCALHRDPQRVAKTEPAFDWIAGDAMIEADVVAAAKGVDIIVHGANPPGYRNWAKLAPTMLANTIAAAKTSGARILFPGNVYNFGPDAFPRLTELSPQHPSTRKGRIRVGMEQTLRDSGVRVLIVRAGDFIGTRPGSDWLSLGMIPRGKPLGAVTYAGPLEVAHTWTWLPDMAEAFVRLLAGELADFEVFHMRGYAITGHELVAALESLTDRKLAVSRLPWLALKVAAPFNESLREMLEMRYLWETPVLMDNTRLVQRVGHEPQTALAEALAQALVGLDILPASAARKAA
jgi:nucleoside-diphosphate-sugar epimerase